MTEDEMPENAKDKIPKAFGYKEVKPLPLPEVKTTPKATSPGQPIVGSIRDNSGEIVFHRGTSDVKIKTW